MDRKAMVSEFQKLMNVPTRPMSAKSQRYVPWPIR
jgi:hypothetical protein